MDLIKELNKEALQKETANVQVGDTVRVHVKVKEGSRERIQVFEGFRLSFSAQLKADYSFSLTLAPLPTRPRR